MSFGWVSARVYLVFWRPPGSDSSWLAGHRGWQKLSRRSELIRECKSLSLALHAQKDCYFFLSSFSVDLYLKHKEIVSFLPIIQLTRCGIIEIWDSIEIIYTGYEVSTVENLVQSLDGWLNCSKNARSLWQTRNWNVISVIQLVWAICSGYSVRWTPWEHICGDRRVNEMW